MKQGWEIKKLGEVCETSSGGTPSKTHKEYYEGGNIPWLRSGEVSQGLIYDTKLYITAEGLDNSSAKIFPIDTVVIAMYGATVGQVGVLKNAMSTNQAVCGIFPTPKFAPLFLAYYLKAKKSYFLSLAAGGAQPNISQQIIRDTYIPVPPREEQERIVEELDCLSGVIEKKREQLKQLDALAQSIFHQMFGDPITNEKRWEVKKMGEVGKVITGNTPSTKDEENYSSNDYCFVKPSDIGKDYVAKIENTEFYISEKAFSQSRRLSKGSVLTTCIGIIGKVGILKVDATCNQQINAILPDENSISEYVAWAIYLTRSVLENIANAPVVPIINKGEFSNIVIPLPPKVLQQEFAEKIDAIEKQKELIKQSITQTEELFNSRMDYYFN